MQTVTVEFVQPWRGYAAGDRAELKVERARQLLDQGYVAGDVPAPEPPADGGAAVEIDRGLLTKLERTNKSQRDEIAKLRDQLKRAHKRIAELQAETGKLATASDPAAAEETAETAEETDAPTDQDTDADADTVPVSDETIEPPAEPVGWRDRPVAALSIAASVRGALLQAGFQTAGQVADDLADNAGKVQAIKGLGDAKVEKLREHLAALEAAAAA